VPAARQQKQDPVTGSQEKIVKDLPNVAEEDFKGLREVGHHRSRPLA
jgi:hypothetical protein